MKRMTADAKLKIVEKYFSTQEGYIVTVKYYGENVPSNSITVEGPGFFRFSWSTSWPAPQVSCMLTYDTAKMLLQLTALIEL